MPDLTEFDGAIRRKARSVDWGVAELAARQHGTLAHSQLIEVGLSAHAIQRRLRAGRLHRIHRGVYAVGHRALPANGRAMAAALAYGDGALVSHRSAAALWGLIDDARAVIDVTAAAKRRSRPGIHFHSARSLHPQDRAEIEGVPVTSVARTLLDLAEAVSRRRLVYAAEQAERLGSLDIRAVEELIARGRGRRSARPLAAAIAAIHPEAKYSRSQLERRFLAFCEERRIPAPALNVAVAGFTVDALWARQRVVVELDSWTHHRGRSAFEADRRRDAALRLAGHEVLRVTWRWLADEPDDLERTLLALLASAPRSPAATA